MKNNYLIRLRKIVGLFTLLSLVIFSNCTKEYVPNQNKEIVWTPVSHLSCIKPADLQAVKVNMTEAVITWRECPAAYEYRVIDTKNLTDPSASATDITIYTSKNSVHLTNLNPKTVYTFRITSVCHDDPATPWAEISFRTSVE